ncbi:MAG: hypothetical protein IJ752_09825 [Alphaproteobacteria bacterium]|nr:hypothetical protein [Alphaproteobacteria bacterium]
MKRFFYLVLFCLCLNSCSSPTRIYYWAKENTGAERFAQDHNHCLQKADYWPWTFHIPLALSAETLDLRLNLKNGGIWANFSPYPGAMPIFVNTATPSKTVIYWRYASCMKKAGYRERRPYGGPL